MTVADILKRNNNNADALRLAAAIAVMWGHAYFIQPLTGVSEPVEDWLGFDYSGSLAVKFFFFLSGMLVTSSLLHNRSVSKFILGRSFRVFPALIMSSVVGLFVIGPLVTTLPSHDYFSNTWMYFHVVFQPYLAYTIPGAFQNNAITSANGALWTIVYELTMYSLLLGLWLAGLFRDRRVATVFLGCVSMAFLWRPQLVGTLGLSNLNDAGMLVSMFALGSLLSLHKDRIEVDLRVVAGFALLAFILRRSPAFQWLFYADFLLGSVWLMSTELLLSFRLPGDFSYGVYVYGWTIQQVVARAFPAHGPFFNQAVSIPLALCVGAASWFIVEKRCIRFGHSVGLALANMRLTPTPGPFFSLGISE